MVRSLRRVGITALFLVAIVEGRAHAEDPPTSDTLFLNTACIGIKDPLKAAYEPSRLTGSGAFDANVARLVMPDGTQRFMVAYDDAGQWRKSSGIAPKFALVDLTKEGLKVVKKDVWLGSALFDKDRLFMRPSIAVLAGDGQSPGYFFLTGASEDNGTSGNPRTTALIYDANGEPILNVVGTSTAGKAYGPRGERGVDMGAIAGRDNDKQQGASDIKFIGKDPQGRQVVAMAFQENNREAYVALYAVQIRGRGVDPTQPGATITAINTAVLLQAESRHCRPTCALAEGSNPSTFACATVHANEQPAEKGITVGRFDSRTGALIGTANDVVVPSTTPGAPGTSPTATIQGGVFTAPKGYRFSQSELRCADSGCTSYVLQTSHLMKSTRTGDDGHTPTGHATDVLLLDGQSLGVTAFSTVGNFAHTFTVPLEYGPGDGAPAIGVLSTSLSGMKPAGLQVLPLDLASKTITAPSNDHRYSVAYFSNSGDVVARGLRNPRNQGRGFLFATPNVPNPGANGGWMAGITAFTAVPIPTFGATAEGNFMGLDLCFVPSKHLATYTKTAPGKVIRWNEAPIGAPPDPANPNGATGDTAADGASAAGRRAGGDNSSGCSMSSASNNAAQLGLLLILGGTALLARRRRSF